MDALDPDEQAYVTFDEAFIAHTGEPKPEDFYQRASRLHIERMIEEDA